ncbi:MAG TPA: class I SAM-dependent methyltransferase [Ktedonobacteraceae bacterium]|jgi:SAM-dependent methyltransferase|nr:class I SAM-dependent methyltransferase [Ktedonobacteraceae bacterium]
MTPRLRKLLFETLYKNKYLYRFASTVPFAGQWRIWQRLVLPRIHGHDVLELGCGLGDLLADMTLAGYHCQAVEQSLPMVEAARQTMQRRAPGQKAWVIHGSAQHLPFSDESFDTVASTFPSEYIYDPDTIAEVERVLRPGGRLIVVEGANLLPVGFFQPLLVLLQALVYGPAAVFGPRNHRNLDEEVQRSSYTSNSEDDVASTNRDMRTGYTIDVLEDAWFGKHIPLEQNGLRRRSERVRSRRWEVYITIGEKV